MANTYSQILIQLVFSVKRRKPLIREEFRERLEKYMTGIVQRNGHKLLAIYCMPDHCHVLVGLRPHQSIAELMRQLKSDSSKWLNSERLIGGHFSWQTGYGAFSYSNSACQNVIKYIMNQRSHHQKADYQSEYFKLLEEFQVDYDNKYALG